MAFDDKGVSWTERLTLRAIRGIGLLLERVGLLPVDRQRGSAVPRASRRPRADANKPASYVFEVEAVNAQQDPLKFLGRAAIGVAMIDGEFLMKPCDVVVREKASGRVVMTHSYGSNYEGANVDLASIEGALLRMSVGEFCEEYTLDTE